MLSKRQKDIITQLQKETDWIKGAELAARVNVTSRTVRNDINSINYEFRSLIESSASGYRLTPGTPIPPAIFQSSKYAGREERITYILGKLLSQEGALDLYDLADELYVSLQTLEKDTRYMEQELTPFHLSLQKKAALIKVTGNEHDKRRMLSNLVYSELNEKFHDLVTYRKYFEDVELYTIKAMLYEVMGAYNVSASEYSINAIVLHLGIAISRVKINKMIGNEDYGMITEDSTDYRLAKQIAGRVMEDFGITLPPEEVHYLAFILFGKIKPDYQELTIDNLEEKAGKECVQLAGELIDEINKTYGLHFYDSDVFVRFVIHLKDLLVRAKNNIFSKNPLKETIKNSYPLIYDVGVFIAEKLYSKTGYPIYEDEIAYLAIHVGACLESTSSKSRMNALLICPQYYNIHSTITARLMKRFDDTMAIVGVEPHLRPESLDEDLDLILTTAELFVEPNTFQGEIVTINPFPKDSDFQKIETAVKRLKDRHRKEEFTFMTRSSIRPELFQYAASCPDEWTAIRILADQMKALEYVSDSFYEDVCKREKLSSTTFGGGFAIPHSIQMDAAQTCIAVMISKTPIPWGNFSVSLVLLIAINEEDTRRFADFYEELIMLLLAEENRKALCRAKTYDDFIADIEKALTGV